MPFKEVRLNKEGTNRKDFKFIFDAWINDKIIVSRHYTSDCWWECVCVPDIMNRRIYAIKSEIFNFVRPHATFAGKCWKMK